MKRKLPSFSENYQEALRMHLGKGRNASPESARGLGIQAIEAGVPTLELAKLHEKTLVLELLPACPAAKRAALVKQAGLFFATAVAPYDKSEHDIRQAARLKGIIESLSRRTVELAASNLSLSSEVDRRKAVEVALTKSKQRNLRSLEESELLKEQLRELSRQILSAQEDERKKISRDLHDVFTQTLVGINVCLATLKKEAEINSSGIGRNIALTQKLVTESVNMVHQFARELRPAILDDLGLIPALHSYMKQFKAQTGVHPCLTASAAVEQLDSARLTALFRVAQEALTNVGKHSGGTRVTIDIRKHAKVIRMKIEDDGKSFEVASVMLARGGKRLGLLGMRERLEMVGGSFRIESAPGKGTLVTADVPAGESVRGSHASKKLSTQP